MALATRATTVTSLLSGVLLLTSLAWSPAQSSPIDTATISAGSAVEREGAPLLTLQRFTDEQTPTDLQSLEHEQALTDEQQRLVDWAHERFTGAGLDFPEVDYVFFDGVRYCDGQVGFYFPDTNTLQMCRPDQKTMLHELAHAWGRQYLTSEQRQQFAASRGATAWNDRDQAWEQRPTEYAAETMTWALMDEDVTVAWVDENGKKTRTLLTIPGTSRRELATAYRRLTGVEPLYRNLDTIDESASDLRPVGKLGA